MQNIDISNLVKALVSIILLAISVGQFDKIRDFALREGIKAITLQDYKPTYFKFGGTTSRAR